MRPCEPTAGSAERHKIRDAILALFYAKKAQHQALLRADVEAHLKHRFKPRDIHDALDWIRSRQLWGHPKLLAWTASGWLLTDEGERLVRDRIGL